MERHRLIQRWWARSLFEWAGRLLNVHLDFPDVEDLPAGPFILASRHVSMVDAVLPIPMVTGLLDRFAHYVLKDELRWDAAIGSFGPRLNNVFVARGDDTGGDLARIRTMVLNAQPNAAFVIFPEGTYATQGRRRRVLASLRRRSENGELDPSTVRRAEELKHLLPPKTLGSTELQNAVPEAPIVVVAHVGLEGAAKLQGLRKRMSLRRPVTIRWWVYSPRQLPSNDEAFAVWLQEVWLDADRWIDDQLNPGSSPSTSSASRR